MIVYVASSYHTLAATDCSLHPINSLSSAFLPLSSLLEDAEWPASRISQLLAFFDPLRPLYRHTLLPSLASHPSALPQLTTATYRVDYYLRSNLAEQIRQPVVLLGLGVTGGAGGVVGRGRGEGEGVLEFSATAEELHDMLAKVKEAVRAAQQRHDD